MGKEIGTLKLGIAFISHGASVRKDRGAELRTQLSRIINELEGVEIFSWKSILWQPDQYPIKQRKYFRLLSFRIRASREWGDRSWLNALYQTLVFEFRQILSGRSQLLIAQKNLFVAIIVHEKHVRAWTSALDDSIDALLVLEDDAILKDCDDKVLSQAFAFVRQALPTFVNLSKGNDLKGYAKEYFKGDEHKGWFKLKAADTACAYMVNRPGLKLLAEHCSQRADTAVLAVDFVISDAMLRNKEFEVLHTDSPLFTNGTLFGVYESQTGSLPRDMTKNRE